MKRFMKYITVLVISTLLCSCDDFLSSPPDKNASIVPSKIEDLESLLNNYTKFSPENNRTFVCSTDDFDILKDAYNAKSSIYRIQTVQFATWDKEMVQYDTEESFWQNEYSKIFAANLVLYYLPRVDGDASRKEVLRKEAHFIRAYSLFELAQTYCLPYNEQTKNELGLVIKESTDFDEQPIRASLENTYNAIEKDLAEALTLNEAMRKTNNYYNTWRASKAAVHAFAARFYLIMNRYDTSLKYAEIALGEHSQIVNYNTEMYFSDIIEEKYINGKKVEIIYPYTHENRFYQPTDMMGWKELYYYRFLVDETWWATPSQELLSYYDTEYDLRYKYHFVKNYSYSRDLISPPFEYPGYIFFDSDRMPSGPTVAEMLLIKAEILARQGDVSKSLETVNVLRRNRMDKNAPIDRINLSASSKQEAIAVILAERRREMPFVHRWSDIRRYNNNDYPNDDINALTRSFYKYNESTILGDIPMEYTITKGSRRFAAPIPDEDIHTSGGVILQNKY